MAEERSTQTATAKTAGLPNWWRYGVIGLLIVGIGFRFYQLDAKVYWIDEVSTSLRMSGHTRTEFVQEMFTGEVVSAATLQQYQQLTPDKTWNDTIDALMGTPEHTPLYFLLVRLWSGWFGDSIASIRTLSVLISLLVFPALFWLCRELFESPAVAWVAMGLVAISPLHVLYAQEARPYSLLTVMILLSSAVQLWAKRQMTRSSWILYGATVAIGLYTQLLFGLVAIAHGVYVLLTGFLTALSSRKTVGKALRESLFSPILWSYGWATIAAFVTLVPWLVVLVTRLDRVQETTASLREAHPFSYVLDQWLLNISRVFLNQELGAANLILALVALVALIYLYRTTPKSTGLLVVSLVAVPFLALALPDLGWGGERSTRIRYLFPAYLGLQIALAYWFATQAIPARRWWQKLCLVGTIALILGGIWGNWTSAQATVWWNKSLPRSGYYPWVASVINQAPKPLVISDGDPSDILAISHLLNPEVQFQLVTTPRTLTVASGFETIFLLTPSKPLQNRLTRRDYQLIPLAEDPDEADRHSTRLWQVKPKP